MEDDLSLLGVIPSDRKKLESMGITTLEQLALMTAAGLGLGSTKGNMFIQRSRNILANRSIDSIDIIDQDHVDVKIKRTDRAVIKSVATILEVNAGGQGNSSLKIDGNQLHLTRRSQEFNKVLQKADALDEILQAKRADDRERAGITLPDKELFDFAKERGFTGFWKNVFRDIQGNDIMKKVITTSLFSTFDAPIHSLIIGEPGSSKTMSKEIIDDQLTGIINVGSNTTRSGLVCNLGTGDLGALPHANKKVILVDEFDKIPQADIEYCYELLSNGKCTVHSAKIHKNIVSNFIMIAFANPKTRVFGKNALADIGLSPLLMSRCALIVKVQDISKDERLELFRKKFYGGGELKEKHDYYDQWVKLSRTYEPEITASEKIVERYIQEIDQIVEKYYSSSLRRDLRMADYIRRIPRAIARAQFSPIDDNVIHEAEKVIKESIDSWK